MTNLVDLTLAPGRAPYVEPPLLLAPLRTKGRPKVVGNPLTNLHHALIEARNAGNDRLLLAPMLDNLRHIGHHQVARGTSFLVYGAPDEGILVACAGRVLPFVLFSDADMDGTRAALATLVPLWEDMARAPWVLAPAHVAGSAWPEHAIAPDWLAVRNGSILDEAWLHTVLAGLMLDRGLTEGVALLVGGRFDARGAYVPPHLRHRTPMSREENAEVLATPGLDVFQLARGPFPCLRQGPYGAGVVAKCSADSLPTTAHDKMAALHAWRSCLTDVGTNG